MRLRSTLKALVILSWFAAAPLPAVAGENEASPSATAFFIDLKDGDTVQSPLLVKFGSKELSIEPAGAVKANSGHFHLLIDRTLSPDEMRFAIPAEDKSLHFGKAQAETTLNLAPGAHTLQIVMGDGAQELHKTPIMSPVITITVK